MAKRSAVMERQRNFRTLEPTSIIKWTKGKIVEGSIDAIRPSTSNRFKGQTFLLDLITNTGKATYGCPTILHNYLRNLNTNAYVRITCLGKIQVPNGTAWDFKVELEDNDSPDDYIDPSEKKD